MLLPGTRDTSWLLYFYTVLLVTSRTCVCSGAGGCPRACFCNTISQIVYCSRRGLPYIPDGIPRDTLNLNLNGNVFRTTHLQRANFSRYPALEHLYLSECGVEVIEVDTFIDLSNLQWVDLSNNRIKELRDYTFRGLTLMHLFLNGNRNIQLRPKSFAGLETTGLYLHDCSLRKLSVDVLAPLNLTLRYLWLNGNELERMDKKLLPMYQTLQHLRLGSNPIHCNCEMLWLKEFLDKNEEIFKGATPPSCRTPQRLRGRIFNTLNAYDFTCQPPVFNNIDAAFDNTRGRLRCTASGDPAPTLFWIQPTGTSSKYSPPADEDVRINEGVLSLTHNPHEEKDLTGMYICVANNEAGNVTLTLNVSWPKGSKTTVVAVVEPTLPPSSTTGSTTAKDEPQQKSPPSQSRPGRDRYNFTALNMLDFNRRHGERQFNLTELVGAIIGTHVCTLLLCLIFMPIYLKRQWKRRHHSMEKPPNEATLYLNGLRHHPDYLDTPSPHKHEKR